MAITIHYHEISTLVTPGGTATFNASTGDTLWIVPSRSSGLGSSRVRSPFDHKGQTDGYNLHDFFEEGQHILLAGDLRVRSVVTESGIVSAQKTLASGLLGKLKTILRATGTLNFTSGATITVKWELLCEWPVLEGIQKGFLFNLVSASPPST